MGGTGSGKTTLANVLLYARGYTLALRSKADPAPLPGTRITRAEAFTRDPEIDRYVLDPPYEHQLPAFWNALEAVWRQGRWTVYFDELFYLTQLKDKEHRLESRINRLLTQGRSKKISVVCGMQRPVQVTRFALSESTHIIAFSMSGRDIRTTLREETTEEFAREVETLQRYEFAWLYRPTREIWRGRVQQLLAPVAQDA